MVGVDTVFHLASVERQGARADLQDIDNQGTRTIVEAAKDASIDRFFFLSHLGADRASAYPVLKTKAIAEEYVRRSGIDYTILRTALVFGLNDGFTTGLAQILSSTPFFFLMPGDGKVLIQPLWVEDLTTCLVWSLDDPETRNRTLEIGGPEYLTFDQVVKLVMKEIRAPRLVLNIPPLYLRWLTVTLDTIFPRLPATVFWLDYLAANRTTALDTMPRVFNLMPSRLNQRVAYLREQNWRRSLLRLLRG